MNYRRISGGWRIKNSDNDVYCKGTDFYVFEFMGCRMTVGLCGDFLTNAVIEKLPKDIDAVLWPAFVCFGKKQWKAS
jgi:hypothetical protein